MIFAIGPDSAYLILGLSIIMSIITHHPILSQDHDFGFSYQNCLSHQTDVKTNLFYEHV